MKVFIILSFIILKISGTALKASLSLLTVLRRWFKKYLLFAFFLLNISLAGGGAVNFLKGRLIGESISALAALFVFDIFTISLWRLSENGEALKRLEYFLYHFGIKDLKKNWSAYFGENTSRAGTKRREKGFKASGAYQAGQERSEGQEYYGSQEQEESYTGGSYQEQYQSDEQGSRWKQDWEETEEGGCAEEYFSDISSQEELKKRHRELMKRFHPDNAGGSAELCKEINRQYEEILRYRFG